MRFHVPSLPHTQTVAESHSWCAYTEKVRKFCDMMMSLGHEVYLYAGEFNEARCTEHIQCLTEIERFSYFGDSVPEFDDNHPGWAQFNDAVIHEIGHRKHPGDILALIGGLAQKRIADCHPDLMEVEFGIGYEGTFAKFRVFESYAWMHTIYGWQQRPATADGIFTDAVIPNYWNPDEFSLGTGEGGYLLYIGRLIERKGVQIAVQVAKKTNLKLLIAGTGDYRPWSSSDNVEYVGHVNPAERSRLMGDAIATLVPTRYLEPFGGVSIESMLCGTPAITTDWGAFPENIPGKYRCRSLKQFELAVRMAEQESHMDRVHRRQEAVSRWSMDIIKHHYDHYFHQISKLYGGNFFQREPLDQRTGQELSSVQ